jgi:hypothetical protein
MNKRDEEGKMVHSELEDLLNFGRMDLEAGYAKYARGYFEKALLIDSTNQEALTGLARIEKMLEGKTAEPGEPEDVASEPEIRAEQVKGEEAKIEIPCPFCKEAMDIEASTCPHCGKTGGFDYPYLMLWGLMAAAVATLINMVLFMAKDFDSRANALVRLTTYCCSPVPWIIIVLGISVALIIGSSHADREKERILAQKLTQTKAGDGGVNG